MQVRTIVQDAWSVLDHKIKYKKSIPHALKRRINRLAALFELADQEFLHIRDETRSLEEQAAASITPAAQPTPTPRAHGAQLDAFSFLTLAQRHFPTYHFLSHKVDGFVEELLEVDPTLTAEQIEAAHVAAESRLQDYREYQQQRYLNRLNPYTTIRHALYLYNREKYAPLLFDLQRNNLISWLEERK